MEQHEHPSPDGARLCRLFEQGKIPHGPRWYGCALDDGVIVARVFGEEAVWSTEGRYLALSEWLTTEAGEGPDTRLFLCDLEERRVHTFARERGGFATPLRFDGPLLVYRRDVPRAGDEDDLRELDVTQVISWEPLEILA